MPTGKLEHRHRPHRERRGRPEPKVFLGSYMPFAGVRYFRILDERDVSRRQPRIGPVGWCRRRRSPMEGSTEKAC
jgi:hypothetical protein